MNIRSLLAVFLSAAPISAANSPSREVLTAMTYNLRFASETPPNAWAVRRPLVAETIRNAGPDVIGTQEGLYSQLKDLAHDLPEFAWIGLGREGGSRGEFMAVFYRIELLEPMAFDHFWLSGTPELIGSTTWGNKYKRMVTWVQFRDRLTGHQFLFWNTHFDHEVQGAREKSAELLRNRVEQFGTTFPVFLAGDFNAPAGNSLAYSILTEGEFFRDTWLAAPERIGGSVGTFNDFGADPDGGARIDWILVRGNMDVLSAEIVTKHFESQYASDHYPVVVRLRIAGQ